MKIKRSKLHRMLKKRLGLSKLGFKSERWLGRYRVDEINYELKTIVEINGDAVHGNPRVYAAHDLLPYGITANEKWTEDAERLTYLESLGYSVVVVWESDDHKLKKKLIEMVLRTRVNKAAVAKKKKRKSKKRNENTRTKA